MGFHDVICVLAAGHIALIKLSSQDQKLIPFLLNKLTEIEPAFADQFRLVAKLEGYDAVIATGSNNTSRYFEYYFSKVPHIIRKNRNSVAILNGTETAEELEALGKDIFDYFGLGCRNVSKLYVPKGYQFDTFFQSLDKFKPVIDHHKYHNNYDYNKSILLVNREDHLDNGFLLVKRDERLASPLAVLHYEEYESPEAVKAKLDNKSSEIQCVVSNTDSDIFSFSFGQAQYPKLWDYADGIDTMKFLTGLGMADH
ncbi:MAG TPA: acyl-CoA reductase [Sphingobacteriaceae bacterium]